MPTITHDFDHLAFFSESRDGMMKRIDEVIANHSEYTNVSISLDVDYGDPVLTFHGTRELTPDEIKKQEATEFAQKAMRYSEYMKLKKEFEP